MLASFLNHVFVDGISFTFAVFFPEFLAAFDAGVGKTTLVGSLLVGTYLLSGPIASGLTNKFGCRAVCIVGGVIASLSFFAASYATSINFLMMTYGVSAGTYSCTLLKYISIVHAHVQVLYSDTDHQPALLSRAKQSNYSSLGRIT